MKRRKPVGRHDQEEGLRDPYEVLGVDRTTSSAELQKVFRKLAKTLHPDLNPGDKSAEDKFKEVAAA